MAVPLLIMAMFINIGVTYDQYTKKNYREAILTSFIAGLCVMALLIAIIFSDKL